MSERDAIRYRKQMQALDPKQLRMTRRKRDPIAPVRPLTAYMWFCKQNWKAVSDKNCKLTAQQKMKELAKMWAECDENARKKFEEYADCDRKCYQMEKIEYKKNCKK